MKKILIIIIAAVIALSSLSAAREYIIFAGSVGFDKETGEIPSPGIYSQYQFGFSLSDKVSLGFGTYITAGFPINGIKDTGYSALVNLAVGPAFALKLSPGNSITFILGPEAALPAAEYKYKDKAGFGAGFALAYTFTPQSEQNERVQMGITCGFSGSLTHYENEDGVSYSGRAFIGFTVLQPFVGVHYHDVYEAVLDTVYYRY